MIRQVDLVTRRPLRLATAAIAIGVVGVTSSLSCRQIVGITDNPPTNLTTSACGLPYGTTSCASCANANCCAESNACAADSIICNPYESCLALCAGDPGCRSKCTIDNPVPTVSSAPVSALSACLAKNCETQCGLSCGGFAGYFSMPDAAPACATCLEKNACSSERSCGTSAECDAFWRCYLACDTPDCHAVCALTHDAGVEQFQPLYSAFASTCSGPCGYGAYWACVGHVVWPNANSAEVTWTGWVYDYQTKQGVSGAQVTICTNCPCNSPGNVVVAPPGQTDSTGHSMIKFTQGIFNSGLGSAYCWQVSAPGYLTTFGYPGFPAVETKLALNPLNPGTVYGTPIQTPANQMSDESTLATYDPTRSIWVGAQVLDCLTNPVPVGGADVSINVRDPMMVPYNAIDAGADAWPTVATGGVNLFSDTALFFNVPVDAGSVTLTATVPGVGAVSGETIAVAPNTVTAVVMPPTPNPTHPNGSPNPP